MDITMNIVFPKGKPANYTGNRKQGNSQFVTSGPLVNVADHQWREKSPEATNGTDKPGNCTGISFGNIRYHLKDYPITNSGRKANQDNSRNKEVLIMETKHNPNSKYDDCNEHPLEQSHWPLPVR